MNHNCNDCNQNEKNTIQAETGRLSVRKSVNTAAILVLLFLSTVFSVVFAVFYGYLDERLLISAFSLCAASAILSFLLVHWRNPVVLISCVLSFGTAVVIGADPLLAGQAVSAVLVISAVIGIVVLRRIDTFKMLLLGTLLFFVLYIFITFMSLVNTYGSVSEGVSQIKSSVMYSLSGYLSMFENSDNMHANLRGQINLILDYFAIFLPSIYMIAALMSSWFLLSVFRLFSRFAGTFKTLFAQKMRIPKAFSAGYLVISLVSFFSTAFPIHFSSVAVNLYYVLMTIFAGVGIKELFFSFRHIRSLFIKIIISCFVVGAVLFSWYIVLLYLPVIFPLISYFGVFRSLKALPKKNIQ